MNNNAFFNPHSHKILLASGSPHKRKLLDILGIDFETYSPDIDESQRKQELPRFYALRLAEIKAAAAVQKYPEHVIIGLDNVVSRGRKIYDKARTDEDVRVFLKDMSGKTCMVHTGLSVRFPGGAHRNRIVSGKVKFKNFSRDEIEFYVASKEGLDCAGGLAIEGIGTVLIKNIHGKQDAIIGMPLYELSNILRGHSDG